MRSRICTQCRQAMTRHRPPLPSSPRPRATSSSSSSSSISTAPPYLLRPIATTSTSRSARETITSYLSEPSWSVRSLLASPPSSSTTTTTTTTANEKEADVGEEEPIDPRTLHRLLRLSALPQPRNAEEESRMLSTLSSQLRFVRAVRGVDTEGVAPLRAIRDDTAAAVAEERTVGLADLEQALAAEDVIGHARRPRRRRQPQHRSEMAESEKTKHIDENDNRAAVENWDVLGGASEREGRYFVVRSGGKEGGDGTSITATTTTGIN
ncbi:hypothetical protein F4778DRAFT_456665 [Xylariomycetidae sp. FL2044]|nr:hypothetical protein F4778DRAFT_456665 [Xylariomycetidae sp. FL2044]